MAFQTPSPTLFVGNLEGKTKKPELRKQLYALFTPYGRVIDIVAKKHDGGRGQAFIVFDETASATAALRGLQGEDFYKRQLSIAYAKKPSNATLERTDPSASREAAAIEAAKLVVSRAQGEYEALERERKRDFEGGEDEAVERAAKRAKQDDDDMEIEMEDEDDVTGTAVAVVATNLPAECSADIMDALFSQYTGFTGASALPDSYAVPSSHAAPSTGAKSFRATFSSRAEAEAVIAPLQGYLMKPGWEMSISVE